MPGFPASKLQRIISDILSAIVNGTQTGITVAINTASKVINFTVRVDDSTIKINESNNLYAEDGSTSQKGIVQLSNSYAGTSEVLAVTEKALSDGLANLDLSSIEAELDNKVDRVFITEADDDIIGSINETDVMTENGKVYTTTPYSNPPHYATNKTFTEEGQCFIYSEIEYGLDIYIRVPSPIVCDSVTIYPAIGRDLTEFPTDFVILGILTDPWGGDMCIYLGDAIVSTPDNYDPIKINFTNETAYEGYALSMYANASSSLASIQEVTFGGGGGVDREKVLSANDFTDVLKEKLDNISENATAVEDSTTNGNILIDTVETVVYDDSDCVKTNIEINGHALTENVSLNTLDIPDAADRRYCTDAEKTVIGNTSGTNTGDQNLSGYVQTTVQINGHALNSNITLNALDVGLGNVTNDAQLKIASNLSDLNNRQTALNNITNVSSATNEHVLTKDTATGNATWKEAAGGSGTDSNAIHDNVASEILSITEKTSIANNDLFIIEDSADSYNKKKITKSNAIKTGLTLIDTKVYNVLYPSTLEFTSGIDDTYSKYIIVVRNLVPATNNVNLQVRVSEDSGSTWKSGASDYNWFVYNVAPGDPNTSSDTDSSYLEISKYVGNSGATGKGISCTIEIYNPSDTSYSKNFYWTGFLRKYNGVQSITWGGGDYDGTTNAINGIQLFFSSGDIASGMAYLYGVGRAA